MGFIGQGLGDLQVGPTADRQQTLMWASLLLVVSLILLKSMLKGARRLISRWTPEPGAG